MWISGKLFEVNVIFLPSLIPSFVHVVDFREDKWWGLYNGQCFEKNIVGQFSCSIDYCEIG
jgi:hypothetical protein